MSLFRALINPLPLPGKSPAGLTTSGRLLSTVSGADKVLSAYSYTVTALSIFLRKYGNGKSELADRLAGLQGPVSESRMIFRFFGLIPILQWSIALENNRPERSFPYLIGRLQILSMLAYYPLEHLYFLSAKRVLRWSPKTTGQLMMWAIKAWYAYVVLALLQLQFDHTMLSQQYNKLRLLPKDKRSESETTLTRERRRIRLGLIENIGNLILAQQWSRPQPTFRPEVFALASIAASWPPLLRSWALAKG